MDFAAGVLFVIGPESHTLLLTYFIRVYSIFIHTGKGGGGRVEPERRLDGQ
jgi:hypothetical protein